MCFRTAALPPDVEDDIRADTHDTIVEEARLYAHSRNLRWPLHPEFADQDDLPVACEGPKFQGIGVIRRPASSREIQSTDLEAAPRIVESEVGHVVLFPRALESSELSRLVDPSSSSTTGSEFWRADRPMLDRARDHSNYLVLDREGRPREAATNQRHLNPWASSELLEGLLDYFEDEDEADDFSLSLEKLRRTAKAYRSDQTPQSALYPRESFLGDPIP